MDDYLEKSPNAARMGKAAEYLVSAFCILVTQGQLNVSTSMVDDEGVDLVFHQRGSTATLAVQVKARMLSSTLAQRGSFQAFVRSQTFTPRNGLALLFVSVDDQRGQLDKAWLVPSAEFDKRKGTATRQGRYRFVASLKEGSQDQWARFRLEPLQLPEVILRRLEDLNQVPSVGPQRATPSTAGQE
ncbi:hypothetical protein BJF77_17460 [Kocuria sp. CNJ-770]|uniref:hypothetical protein n=1 Tax=Kocuria sp. CNJ-770 TaxID=1904964 RepID=UPI0009598CE7|nr:hypothetical protein [Kocuria sp. CNJ-770]OLT04001.1 hypothetical protein BJF77_17460 [Kocuria sp. CNJ-770]